MTITSTVTSTQPVGNNAATTFPFNNKVFSAADLVVTLIDTLGNQYAFVNQFNAATGLSYIVNNVDVDGGCSITFSSPPANGWIIDIRSNVLSALAAPWPQQTSIKNQGPYLPELHEDAFDRFIRALQDLYRNTYTFGIHGPDIEATPWPSVGSASQRANQLLGFNGAGVLSLFAASFNNVLTTVFLQNLTGLRALAPKSGGPTAVIVMGAAAPGDGGGGIYYYNAADTTSADNGGTIIVSADGSRWYAAKLWS